LEVQINEKNYYNIVISPESGEIRPLVNWSGSAYITTAAYSNVTSSNNIFKDSPTVTNSADSPGPIMVRVVKSTGEIIGNSKTIFRGKTVTLDPIPAFSGTYTLQAKAVNSSGYYYISID